MEIIRDIFVLYSTYWKPQIDDFILIKSWQIVVPINNNCQESGFCLAELSLVCIPLCCKQMGHCDQNIGKYFILPFKSKLQIRIRLGIRHVDFTMSTMWKSSSCKRFKFIFNRISPVKLLYLISGWDVDSAFSGLLDTHSLLNSKFPNQSSGKMSNSLHICIGDKCHALRKIKCCQTPYQNQTEVTKGLSYRVSTKWWYFLIGLFRHN